MKRIALFIIAMSFALLSLNVHAQDQPAINQTVSELINKYQSTEGINSINLKKGEGLGIAKLAMRKHFGSKFLRGIEQIVIIEYSSAPSNIADELNCEIATRFAKMPLQKEQNDPEKGQTVRMMANSDGSDDKISDIIFVIESDKNRCLVYLHGAIDKESFEDLSD